MAGRTQGILGATIGAMLLTLSGSGAAQQPATPLRPDQARFRALYQEMVETDTSITTGSCTALAGAIEARLLAAGYPASAITRFAVPDHPKEGGLVVTLPGTSRTVKPMLLIGHLDVVVANPKDWTRDPYKMVEENGYFYGRGTADMKAMDAIWVDTMIRFKESGYRPKRTIKLALTCGEETSWAFNGMKWLAQNRPELIAAEFALNEGGGGRSDGKGNLAIANIHVGEKAAVNYRIEATNPGGHSSAPVRDNAIYELSDALQKIAAYRFPVQATPLTRSFLGALGQITPGETGAAMRAFAENPADEAAVALLRATPETVGTLGTTCVATMLRGGHAENALPQSATATVNCRIFPGEGAAATEAALKQVIGNDKVQFRLLTDVTESPESTVPDEVMAALRKVIDARYPGLPIQPYMESGGTDGMHYRARGYATVAISGAASRPQDMFAHGLNERLSVDAFYGGLDHWYRLLKDLAG